MSKFLDFFEFLNEESSEVSPKPSEWKHKIKNEKYWNRILSMQNNQVPIKILDTVIKKQSGWASDRQWEVLKRTESGDKSPYNTKN